jgi:CBS domain-containing protein
VSIYYSVLEAVDALLGGAECLVVPIRHNRRGSAGDAGETMMCWLTVEDVVRFFLGSVALFSPTASRSVSDLCAVRPATALSVAADKDALSAVAPLLRATHSSVAVVSGGRVEGEISPSRLCSLDPSVAAAAFATLSAGELAAFFDCGRALREAALRLVGSRLRRRNLHGLLDLLDGNEPSSPSSSSSSSSPFSSSSSSEDDEEEENGKAPYSRMPTGKHGLWSARWTKGSRVARVPVTCRRGSSLVAVMAQAVTHRVTQVWVVDEDDDELVGVVGFLDVLRVLRHHLLAAPPAPV